MVRREGGLEVMGSNRFMTCDPTDPAAPAWATFLIKNGSAEGLA